VTKKEIAVKKYVVRLSAEERGRLEAMVRTGKNSAQILTRARILLKADVSDAGEGWSDSAIAAALDTSINNVARTRQQLVEEGFEATLKRKYNRRSARPGIFDGAAEAKLIALACSPAPEGFARWSLRLLEEKVIELNIVDKASDNDPADSQKNALKLRHGDEIWESRVIASYHQLAHTERRIIETSERGNPDWEVRNAAFHDTIASACPLRLLKQLRAQAAMPTLHG
jgi:hypothetical protein